MRYWVWLHLQHSGFTGPFDYQPGRHGGTKPWKLPDWQSISDVSHYADRSREGLEHPPPFSPSQIVGSGALTLYRVFEAPSALESKSYRVAVLAGGGDAK